MVPSSSSSLTSRVAGLAFALGLAACTSELPNTAVVFRLDSDYVAPDEVNAVGFTIIEADGSLNGGSSSVVGAPPDSAAGQPGGCGASYLPMLRMATRNPGDRITFDFYAERFEEGGEPRTRLVEQQLVIEMVEGRWLLVPVHLERACEGIDCAAGETCRGGTCVAAEVNPATLEEFDRTRDDEVICN